MKQGTHCEAVGLSSACRRKRAVSELDTIRATDGAVAGGGVGDSIDRALEMVRDGVENDYVSLQMAFDVYGVVIDVHTLAIDEEGTKKRRAEIIERGKSETIVWKEEK